MIAFIVTGLVVLLIQVSKHVTKPGKFKFNKKSKPKAKRNNFSYTHDSTTKGEVIEVESKPHYNALLCNREDIVILDFYSHTCAPCKMLAPYLDKFAMQFENDNFIFGKVNCDELGEIVMENGVKSMPTIVFFEKGHEIHRVVGCDILSIKKFLESHCK